MASHAASSWAPYNGELVEVGLLGVGEAVVEAVEARGHVHEQAVQIGQRPRQRRERILAARPAPARRAGRRQHPLQIRRYRCVLRHALLPHLQIFIRGSF